MRISEHVACFCTCAVSDGKKGLTALPCGRAEGVAGGPLCAGEIQCDHNGMDVSAICMFVSCARRPFWQVRRIGEASNPGPGKFRLRRRGSLGNPGRHAERLRVWQEMQLLRSNPKQLSNEDAELFRSSVKVWHVNIQGLEAHATELAARLRLEVTKPLLICINESFLEPLVHIELEGYSVVARRDRPNSQGRGGVIVYALDEYKESVTDAGNSDINERCWLVVHTANGPFSFCAWYRPPSAGEINSILSYESEFADKTQGCLGHIMLGDINVHSKRWLGYSNGETPEGSELNRVCNDLGLDQHVREPTRRRD